MALETVIDIPCFKCLLNHEISEWNCQPQTCSKLTEWLLYSTKLLEMNKDLKHGHTQKVKRLKRTCLTSTPMFCPECHSTKIINDGFSKVTRHPYLRCKQCGKRFREGFSTKMKAPQKIIERAIELDKQGIYSSRDISHLILKEFGKHISHVTIANWIYNNYLQTKNQKINQR